MKITIPFKTPSVNHLYFNWRGRQILTKEAKELKKKIKEIITTTDYHPTQDPVFHFKHIIQERLS